MKSKLLLLASLLFVVCVSSCSDDDDYETYYSGEYGKMAPQLSFDTTLVGIQKRIVIDTIIVDTSNGVTNSAINYHYVCCYMSKPIEDNTFYKHVYIDLRREKSNDVYKQISFSDDFKRWTFKIHKLYYNKKTNKVNGFTYTIKEELN